QAAARASHDRQHPIILFVGRLDQEKRVDELLRAFAELPEELRGPQGARIELVGNGSCRDDWKKLADELGISDRVNFRCYVSEDDLVEAYGHSDIFCMPGIAELQSLVTLEAMSAAKPIIAANAMALPHLVHPGENGML